LWRSDGTEVGTALVADIDRRNASSVNEYFDYGFVAVGNRIYFQADDGTSRIELWKSDGGVPGASRVRDIAQGPASSLPSSTVLGGGSGLPPPFVEMNGSVF